MVPRRHRHRPMSCGAQVAQPAAGVGVGQREVARQGTVSIAVQVKIKVAKEVSQNPPRYMIGRTLHCPRKNVG